MLCCRHILIWFVARTCLLDVLVLELNLKEEKQNGYGFILYISDLSLLIVLMFRRKKKIVLMFVFCLV